MSGSRVGGDLPWGPFIKDVHTEGGGRGVGPKSRHSKEGLRRFSTRDHTKMETRGGRGPKSRNFYGRPLWRVPWGLWRRQDADVTRSFCGANLARILRPVAYLDYLSLMEQESKESYHSCHWKRDGKRGRERQS